MPVTPCECPRHGWCPRHSCFKTPGAHWHCQNVLARFEEWEQGGGLRSSVITQNPAEVPEPPGMLQRAGNFAQALWQHTLDGFTTVDDAEYERRLAICRGCPSFDSQPVVCRHPSCGCLLTTKARWASSQCPLSRWLDTTAITLE